METQVFTTNSVQLYLNWFTLFIVIFPVILLILTPLYRRYLGIRFSKALLVSIVCVIAFIAAIFNYPYFSLFGRINYPEMDIFTKLVPGSMIVFFAIPYLIMLYRKWIGNHVTEQEKMPNMDGIRSWLRAGNLVCCFGMAFCAWRYFHNPPVISTFVKVLILTIGGLLVYPLLNMLSHFVNRQTAGKEEFARASEKILDLLEKGKINPQESAELLGALYGRNVSSKERDEELKGKENSED